MCTNATSQACAGAMRRACPHSGQTENIMGGCAPETAQAVSSATSRAGKACKAGKPPYLVIIGIERLQRVADGEAAQGRGRSQRTRHAPEFVVCKFQLLEICASGNTTWEMNVRNLAKDVACKVQLFKICTSGSSKKRGQVVENVGGSEVGAPATGVRGEGSLQRAAVHCRAGGVMQPSHKPGSC
jgi:hypothetical protein